MTPNRLRLPFYDRFGRWSNGVTYLGTISCAADTLPNFMPNPQGFAQASPPNCVSDAPYGQSTTDFIVPTHYLATLSPDLLNLRVVDHDAASDHRAEYADDGLSPIHFLQLVQHHMQVQNNESMQQGQKIAFGTFTMLVTEAGRCETLGDALRQFVRSMNRLRPDLIASVRCGRGSLCLSITPRQMMTPSAELETEIFAVTAHCAFRALINEPLQPISVRAPRDGGYQGGIDGPSLMSWLGCDMTRSGSGVTLEYSYADGERVIHPRRHALWVGQEIAHFRDLFADQISENSAPDTGPAPISIIQRVEDLLRQSLFHEPLIAKELGMSTASLRRRMTAAGTSFRAVIDQHRQQRVAALLHTSTPLIDIATEAGYSDLRSLRRACAKWFGTSPADLRRQNRARRAHSPTTESPVAGAVAVAVAVPVAAAA